jgi:hypothetical protein
MRTLTASDAAKAVVRRNTEEVQGKGNFDVFEELFSDDFVDHTPQPNMTPDKAGCASSTAIFATHSRTFMRRSVFELAADYGIQFGGKGSQGVNAKKL